MKKDKEYSGENEKWILFNDRIVIPKNNKPYLVRHTLLSIYKWCSIKYHEILQSDGMCPHDHPWPFITIVLKGGYYEWTPVVGQRDSGRFVGTKYNEQAGFYENCHWHGRGSIMYRPAKWTHRLEVSPGVGKACTLVLTGAVLRPWGFFTKEGWIFWKKHDEKRDC